MYCQSTTTNSLPLSTGLKSAGTCHSSAQKETFKTSNPQIFPSLNPLGALYKQRKVVHPNPMAQDHSYAPEPSKKLKLNVGAEVKVMNNEKSSVCDAKAENLDKDGFRMPKLPARFANKSQNKVQSQTSFESAYNRGFTKAPEKPSFRSRQIRNSNSIKTAKTGGQIKKEQQQQQPQQQILEGLELYSEHIDPVIFSLMIEKLKMDLYLYQVAQGQQMLLNSGAGNMMPFNLSSAIRC